VVKRNVNLVNHKLEAEHAARAEKLFAKEEDDLKDGK
jgi:hypothetical protein